jgi:hypothetical protein
MLMERIKVVVRYADGRVIKGYTQDFHPNKPQFHLFTTDSGLSGKAVEVLVEELKAVFFVVDFEGDPQYNEQKQFAEGSQPLGQRLEVTFADGEVLVGSTVGYNPKRPSFFLFPTDPKSNNLRVFVVSTAVKEVRHL